MNPKIKFHRRKLEILENGSEVARHYGELMYVKYKNPYCWLYFCCGAKYKVEISLSRLLKNLPQMPFFRCSRTDMINICYYREYKVDSALVTMYDGEKFALSFRSSANFKKQKAAMRDISPPCPSCLNCSNETCHDFWLFCLPPDGIYDRNEQTAQGKKIDIESEYKIALRVPAAALEVYRATEGWKKFGNISVIR